MGQAFRLLRGAPSDNDTQEGSGGYAEATDRVSNRNINRISSGQDDGDEIDVGAEVAHQFTETTLKDNSVAPLMNGWKARKAGESQPLNETTGRKRHRSTGKLPIRSRKAIKAVSEEDDAVPQKVSRSDSEPLALELLERYYLSEQPTASNQLRRHGLTSSPESPPPPAAAPPTTQSPLPPPPSKTTTAGNRVVLETPPASIPPTTGPSNSPIPNPPHTETTTTTTTTAHRRRATFHFYLSDPTLGAVPHSYPLNALPSRSTFFHNAIAAHDMVSTPGQVVAASVRVVCARGPSERPIVVPKDAGGKAAWGELLRVIGAVMGRKEEVAGGGGKVECEVRCIAAR
ncbi:MAG: hypothetical protein LQ338_004737 [Usnochroma carphineum]|nr:MAG: hypothetical protein LQ338_004737 [Usnochroma carphineum]